jgi:Domain of unknown function (DUF4402)
MTSHRSLPLLLALALAAAPASAVDLLAVDDLAFGGVACDAAPGTVTVSPSGSLSASGGVTLVGSGDRARPARFRIVGGDPGAAVSLIVPASARLSGASRSIEIGDFRVAPASTLTLDASGGHDIWVGATLRVDSHAAAGDYSGAVTLVAVYE